MKKFYMFMALLLVSGVIFAQAQKRVGAGAGTLSAVKVVKEINTLAASNSKAVIDSLSYDGDSTSNAIGTGAAANFGVYAFFPAATLASHATAGHYILSLKLYINGVTDVSATELRIYSDTLSTALLYSQSFTPIEGWNNVMLITPFAVPSTGNIYIGYDITATGGYPAGCDEGPANPNGNWMSMGSWQHLSDISPTLIGNWHIRAMCGTIPTVPTALCTSLNWDAGNQSVSTSVTSASFTLANIGSGTLTCSGISGLSAPFTTTLVPASVSLATGVTTTFTFTYNPTVAATDNQTVVIATNGGDITINLSGVGLPVSTGLNESFEGTTFPPTGWTMIDQDGDGNNWFQYSYAGTAHTGANSAASASYSGGVLTPTNYLITPMLALSATDSITYWAAPQDKAWPAEYYEVKVSTTGTSPADFTTTLYSYTFTFADTLVDWHRKAHSLSTFAGSNIYIAFVHTNCTDQFYLKIDDVITGGGVSVQEVVDNETFSIYPNPVRNELNITSIASLKNVKIINAIGQEIINENVRGNHYKVNTSSYNKGVYFVQIESEKGKTTKKFIVNE